MRPDELLSFLNTYFGVDRYPTAEQGGLYRPADSPIQRLGLALEPAPALGKWVDEYKLAALWLHRPWQLTPDSLPSGIGVFYHHLPFDETLTMGFNRPLADALGMSAPEEIGYKQADNQSPKRAIGMLGDVAAREFTAWKTWANQTFGGYEQARPGEARPGEAQPGEARPGEARPGEARPGEARPGEARPGEARPGEARPGEARPGEARPGEAQPDRHEAIGRIAVVGAMNEALIQEAAGRGAQLYLTGQYRKSAQAAVDETGLSVIAVGHRRSEEWGLIALAKALSRQFPALTVVHEKSGQSQDQPL